LFKAIPSLIDNLNNAGDFYTKLFDPTNRAQFVERCITWIKANAKLANIDMDLVKLQAIWMYVAVESMDIYQLHTCEPLWSKCLEKLYIK
jgi:hypothetical protein